MSEVRQLRATATQEPPIDADDYGPSDWTPPRNNPGAERMPPQDLEAERAVLGSMLLSPQACDDVIETVTSPEFYRPAHETIFDAITAVHLGGEARPDAITVADHLTKNGQLDKAGGQSYLHELIAGIPTAANAGYYADIVAEKAAQRRLIEAFTRSIQNAYQGTNPTQLYADAHTELELASRALPNTTKTVSSWAPVDFAAVLDGGFVTPKASVLQRRDGKMLLYPEAVHSISGEPGSLKTWVALLAIVQELDAGNSVAFLDFEDNAAPVGARLLQIGADPERLRDPNLWRYIRPDVALNESGALALDEAVADCTIVVIDGVTEVMSLHGWSINDNDDVAAYVAKLPRRIADHGPAVLQIDHVTKDSETRGRYAIGGQHKLASITGTAMKAVIIRSGGRGEHGIIKVVLDKDKHGDVGPSGHTVAEFHLDDTTPGQTFAWLENPTSSTDEDGNFRPTRLMKRVSDFLLTNAGPKSLNDIKKGVKGGNDAIAAAVDALIRDRCIRVEQAGNRTALHHFVTAFEEDS